MPMVVLQGDLDFSTPWENALDQTPFLAQGKVVTVRRGTHDVKEEVGADGVIGDGGHLFDQVMAFLTSDHPAAALAALPDKADLKPLHFVPLDGPSLYERLQTPAGADKK